MFAREFEIFYCKRFQVKTQLMTQCENFCRACDRYYAKMRQIYDLSCRNKLLKNIAFLSFYDMLVYIIYIMRQGGNNFYFQ